MRKVVGIRQKDKRTEDYRRNRDWVEKVRKIALRRTAKCQKPSKFKEVEKKKPLERRGTEGKWAGSAVVASVSFQAAGKATRGRNGERGTTKQNVRREFCDLTSGR